MTPSQITELYALIEAHVDARIELSWIGARDPDDFVGIKADAVDAQTALYTFIEGLQS